MSKVYTLAKIVAKDFDAFKEYEVICGSIIRFKTDSHFLAKDVCDRINSAMLQGAIAEFVTDFGARLDTYFRGRGLELAYDAIDRFKEFNVSVTELNKVCDYTSKSVWQVMYKKVIPFVGCLDQDGRNSREKYYKGISALIQLVTDYNDMYAPALFEKSSFYHLLNTNRINIYA